MMKKVINNLQRAGNPFAPPVMLEGSRSLYGGDTSANRIKPIPFGPLHPLDSPKTQQSLNERDLLKLLNDAEAEIAGMYAAYPPPSEPPKIDWPAISKILRQWIDEWIDSGKSADGVETPSARVFRRSGRIRLEVFAYSQKNRIVLLVTNQGLSLVFDAYERTPGISNEDIAREKLVFFLLSKLRFRLAKCRTVTCGRYFVLKHLKRTYTRGTFCPDCQRAHKLQSAKSATKEDREEAEKKLYRLVAQRFRKPIQRTPSWYKDKRLRASIPKYLNARIEQSDLLRAVYMSGSRKGITAKWLAWKKNWDAIESIIRLGGRLQNQ